MAPLDPTSGSIHLDGCAGCLALATPIALPAFVIWRLKRRLFGHAQPARSSVWRHGQNDPPIPGMVDLVANDANFSLPQFESQVMAGFRVLVGLAPGRLPLVATPGALADRGRLPRRAVIEHGKILSASSGGGRDRIVVSLRGHRSFRVLWWSSWEEQWGFARYTPVAAQSSQPICRNCGAPIEDTPDGMCRHCGYPVPGLIDTWRLEERRPMGNAVLG